MAECGIDGRPLTRFKDRLRVPPVLRPAVVADDAPSTLRVRILPRRLRLHSELPPSDVWTYDGRLPGPTIEVRRGQALRVDWVNSLPTHMPYPVTALSPWTVAHLHGGRTSAIYDGWTENGALNGQTVVADYANEQRATVLTGGLAAGTFVLVCGRSG